MQHYYSAVRAYVMFMTFSKNDKTIYFVFFSLFNPVVYDLSNSEKSVLTEHTFLFSENINIINISFRKLNK